ncbi:fimbrial protein [Serratia fonticola]|uniref:fimbrial protein n=1 Tax=Serratia fonticola TaxID=47917 RepID=UPI003AAFE17C
MINNLISYNVLLGIVSCFFATHVMAVGPAAPVDLRLSINGTILIPAPCKITGQGGSDQITVKFGNAVNTTALDGVNYRQLIDYSVTCDAGINNALSLRFQGNTADFGSGILKTDVNDLGIKITHGEDNTFPLGTLLPFSYPNLPKLYAAPVKRPGATLKGQPFSASATLHVFYQ